MEISLSKALKYKKQLTGEIARVQLLVSHNNSMLTVSRASNDIDVRASFDYLSRLVNNLVELKLALYQANSGIMLDLIIMQELKAEITFLKSINVEHGARANDYSEVVVERDAIIKRKERDDKIQEANRKISDLQDKVDNYNSTKKINFEMISF